MSDQKINHNLNFTLLIIETEIIFFPLPLMSNQKHMHWNGSLSVCLFFCCHWMTGECAAEISLSKHVHHYPFIGTYCLFTVAPFPESPKAGRWSGKPGTKAFLPHPPGPQKCSPLSRHRAFHRAFGRPWVTVESPRTFPKYRSRGDYTVKKIFLQKDCKLKKINKVLYSVMCTIF